MILLPRFYFYLISKTAKPSLSNFKNFKRTLLVGVVIVLASNPEKQFNTLIATIPYSSCEPEPYQRWILKGMLDIEKELKLAEEFWDFLGEEGACNDLLDCFKVAGIELRPEIDEYFLKFNK